MEEAGSQQLGKVCNHRSQMNEAKRLPSDAIHGEKEKKKKGRKKIPKPSSAPTQEHSSFTVTFQECADRHKAFCVTLCQ